MWAMNSFNGLLEVKGQLHTDVDNEFI
jgi:hypothetical protein